METNSKLLPIIDNPNKDDPVDQEIGITAVIVDKLRVQKQKRTMRTHPLFDVKSKSKAELGQTYFGYDGTLGKTANFTSKAKVSSNSIGYKIP